MRTRVTVSVAALLLLGALLAGCQEGRPPANVVEPPGGIGLPNPASVYCEEQGGALEILTDDEGGQYGVCRFDDGSACEEWAFFRGECAPGDEFPATPAP
jgi:putative hemolysin